MAEDIVVGKIHDLGTYTLSECAIIRFAEQWDPLSIHVDRQLATEGTYGSVIASGIHTLAIYQFLASKAVYSSWPIVAGKELRHVRFLRPVRPNDTLNASMEIRVVVPLDDRRQLITVAGKMSNQDDKPVMDLYVDTIVRVSSRGRR